ncbi:MAG: class I SAM-dependent methyltransferase [Anaerolineae bacterium]|nr:class I SAM-dependent methyltransferase [Anaerolineae bacterium]
MDMIKENTSTNYGNWVSSKFIYIPFLMGAFFLGLILVWPGFAILAALCLLSGTYFVYARHAFSPCGGNIQVKLWEMVLERLDWNGKGKALDIGCGNGPLTIALAQRYPDGHVTGIDFWGKKWDYSKAACERNAQTAGVADQTDFQKASASALPFEDGTFEAAVSNFVFHEVSDAEDKRELLKEALRVVKKGGYFAFQDLFLFEELYGEIDDLLETIRTWGITEVAFVDTSASDFVPTALKLPFMVGKAGIIYGEK